jgi:hypothetical protein
MSPFQLAHSASGKTAAVVAAPAQLPAFVVESQTDVPDVLHGAVDIRWANDQGIYLALTSRGVVEAPLVPDQGAVKEMIAGRRTLGGLFLAYHIAASDDYLAAAPPIYLVSWRRLDTPARLEEPFEYVQALDVRDHRLAILGLRSDEQRNFSPDGAIAWVGSLDKKLTDLKPIGFSTTGRGAAAATARGFLGLGGVRFLADGTLLLVPGTQPGVSLLDANGKPLRVWDTAALGIDTDCASLTAEQSKRMAGSIPARQDWLNHHRTVESILPLPQGAAILVRIPEKAAIRWELKLLRRDGTWGTVQVSLRGETANAHLHADSRGNRIALLLYDDSVGVRTAQKARLLTARMDS